MKSLATHAPDSDPVVQRLIEESRARQAKGLFDRERTAELLVGAAFLAVSVPLALLVSSDSPDLLLGLALVVSYAFAARVEFHTGAGWTVPTQLVLVPMLFLLQPASVPLFVAVALLVSKLPEYLRDEVHEQRAVVAIGDAWYSLGPALVFVAAGPGAPDWADWPIYVAAFAAQIGIDTIVSVVRGILGLGLELRKHLPELGSVYLVDALLSPVGLLAAFGADHEPWAFVVIMPLVALLAIFAREREARIENALTLSRAYRGTAHLLAEVLSTSHEYTGSHSRSVVVLAHQVAVEMKLDEKQLQAVEFGALLHDIGKLSVPNAIINKPAALTDDEWALMRRHTTEGERMLEQIGGVLAQAGQVVRSHHERYDGSGYPDGLRGDEIPIAARVITCCDSFNAMTTDRPYKTAMPIADALAELEANAGSQFDPAVVGALLRVVARWRAEAAPAPRLAHEDPPRPGGSTEAKATPDRRRYEVAQPGPRP